MRLTNRLRRKRRSTAKQPPFDRKLGIYISLWGVKSTLAGDSKPQPEETKPEERAPGYEPLE